MEVIPTIEIIKSRIQQAKSQGKTIGFVPTMGYLHEGHLSLMNRASSETDLVVASIYVNPTQFGVNEDLEAYPRDLEKDIQLSEGAGVAILFTPTNKEMYPQGYATYINVEGPLTKRLCAQSREGHFKGVATIVSKLFAIITPDKAYFGQKDAQQLQVIRRMVEDLHMNVDIVGCPIIRESDGLAMSSRNAYLSETERGESVTLSQSLYAAEKMIRRGEKRAKKVKQFIIQRINDSKLTTIDYVEIVNGETLEPVDQIAGNILIALAVKIGDTRLIDNIGLEV